MTEYYSINSDDITYRIIDNEAVILNLKTGEYYSLNETGTFTWKLMEKGITEEGLVEKLTEEFEIDKKNAAQDIKTLLKDLMSEEMISLEKPFLPEENQ